MRSLINSLLILSLFTAWSCEQIIDVPIPEHTPELVMSSFYVSGDDSIRVLLSNTIGVLDSDSLQKFIENATVNLYENDNLLFAIPMTIPGHYVKYLTSPLQFGVEYRLEASANGYESVSAVQTMPDTVVMSNLIYEPEGGVTLDGYIQDKVTFDFKDKPGASNYYQVVVKHLPDTTGFGDYGVSTWSLDPIFEIGWEAPLFNDVTFDGNLYNLILTSDPLFDPSYQVALDFRVITKDKYFLSKSILASFNAEGNPFAEPVIIHSNVENGKGVFSMESRNYRVVY